MPMSRDACDVILGLDGGTTSTVCICMAAMPLSNQPPDVVPVLARSIAGCSNHNSVGGFIFIFISLAVYVIWVFLFFFFFLSGFKEFLFDCVIFYVGFVLKEEI